MLKIDLDKSAAGDLQRLMKQMPKEVEKAISIALFRAGNDMRNEAVELAPFKTGNLRRSITVENRKTEVEVGTNLTYARIQDQGGTIPAHIVEPRKAKALAFVMNGVPVVVKRVSIPAVTVKPYKGRGYLTPAFENMKTGKAQKIFDEEIQRIAK